MQQSDFLRLYVRERVGLMVYSDSMGIMFILAVILAIGFCLELWDFCFNKDGPQRRKWRRWRARKR